MTDVTFVAIDCDNTVVVIFDGAFVVNDGGDLVVVGGDLVFDVADTNDAPDDIVETKAQGRIHGNPVADGWAGAVMQKLPGIQKCDGRTDLPTNQPTNRPTR